MSVSAVTGLACPVKEPGTRREKKKGRMFTRSPHSLHVAREHRGIEQDTPPFPRSSALRSGIEGRLSEGIYLHGMHRALSAARRRPGCRRKPLPQPINLVCVHPM